MTQYLVDTNVISSFAPGRAHKAGLSNQVADWFARSSRDLFISAMTVMEIESGVEQLARRGSVRKSAELSNWFSATLEAYQERVLGFDRAAALMAGRIEAESIVNGRHPGLPDIVIAATAAIHNLTLLTQNLRHFTPLGIRALDPFKDLPEVK